MKYCRKLIACLLVIVLLATTVLAAAPMDPDRLCSLEISFRYEGEALPGASFRVWRVGELSESSVLSLSGPYADYPVVVDGLTNEEFQTASNTLAGYIQRDGLEPDHEGVTDANGLLRFEDLPRGLYLVMGDSYRLSDTEILHHAPQLVILPYRATVSEEWDYDVQMITKCSLEEIEEIPEVVKVLKKWNDAGAEALRPASVTVHLLRNGKIWDTVKLSEKNDWRYTWTDLDPDYNWTVIEDIDEDYTVTVEKFGITYVIPNTITPPPPPPPPPPSEGDIPETGLTWWPALVLGALGVGLISVGLFRRKEDCDEA